MLQELKKLDLCWTSIEEAPEGMDMLIKLRYIDLEVRTLKEIPTRLLPKLVHLQHLSFDVTNRQTSLKVEVSIAPLFVNPTIDKRLTIRGVHKWEGILCVVSLSSFTSSSAHPFQSLKVLILQDLPKLSTLTIKDEGFGSTSTLAPAATFSHLKEIVIINCSSMKMLLPNLQNLEEIYVSRYDEIVEILVATTSEVEEKGSDALIKLYLPKLIDLTLSKLPNLKRICSKSGVMVCDSLEVINVIPDCDKLKRIPLFVPLIVNGQPFAYAPPSLIINSTMVEIIGVG
ncbi:hypothetical protein CXB51_009672 [Gossypium anomalum]|uniref:Disease resistance protein At4g27190-like leucine-rich repeats domain-containing protein n=1 Tax=Gossypium anomalum TaxID=47600 RepID=A0A8J5Z1Q2_9ROSI|nr:hypothetical protein CXB51_009672 [Gossypium anomalum]